MGGYRAHAERSNLQRGAPAITLQRYMTSHRPTLRGAAAALTSVFSLVLSISPPLAAQDVDPPPGAAADPEPAPPPAAAEAAPSAPPAAEPSWNDDASLEERGPGTGEAGVEDSGLIED